MKLLLFNSENDGQLYHGYNRADVFSLSTLSAGNILTVEFTLLRATFSLSSPWERVAASSYSLAIGLYQASDRGELSFQDTFSNLDEYTKSGTFNLNTAAITSALTSATSVSAVMEIRVRDSSSQDHTTYRNEQITLKKQFITAAAVTTPPGEITATQQWVKNTFFPRDGTVSENPCDHFFVKSRPSGIPMLVTVDDNGQLHITQA